MKGAWNWDEQRRTYLTNKQRGNKKSMSLHASTDIKLRTRHIDKFQTETSAIQQMKVI
jgi:hypothetical protein